MRKAGSDTGQSGPWSTIDRKTHDSNLEAGSGQQGYGRLRFLCDGATLNSA